MKFLERAFLSSIACILAFVIGFISCIGAIFGVGYLAFAKLSVDKLEEIGIIDIDTSEWLDVSADVSLTALTVQGLIQEIGTLTGMGDDVTINFLIDRYGLKLDEEILSYIPENLRDVPIARIFSLDGIYELLDSVPVSYILQYIPEGILSEPAIQQLGSKTLKDVISLDLGYLLDGVCVGYLLGVSYELVDGEYRVVFADPANPTLFELIAPIEIGSVLTSISAGGDIVGALTADIQGVMLESLVNAAMGSDAFALPGLLDGKTVADIIVVDEETGMSSLQITALLEGRTLGDLLGYEPIYHEDRIIGWTDSEGQNVSGVMRGLAGVSVDGILDEGFDFTTLVSDIYIGDVLEYTPVYDENGAIVDWLDAEGQSVDGIYKDLASKTISELSEGGFSIDTILGEDTKIGEIIGYKYNEETGEWEDENGAPLTGAVAVFADLKFSELSDSNTVSDKINKMKLAEALGYTKDGDTWRDSEGKEITGIMAVLADSQIGSIASDVNDIEIGAVMGYKFDEESGKWRNDDGDDLTGVMAAFADLSISDLSDNSKFTSRLNSVTLADALGYTRTEDGLVDSNGQPVTGIMAVLADSQIGSIGSDVNNIEIGRIMGYTFDEESGTWRNDNGDELTGVMAAFADLTVSSMSDSNVVSEKIKTVKLADALGYTLVDGVWMDGDKPVTGVMKVVADSSIGNVSDKINTSPLGDILGYENRDGKWYKGDEPVSNLVATISDSTLQDMGTTLTDMTLGDVLGSNAFDSGFLKLADPNWKVAEFGVEMNAMFENTTMGEYYEAGVINLDPGTVMTLNALDDFTGNSWRETTINGFINYVVGALRI